MLSFTVAFAVSACCNNASSYFGDGYMVPPQNLILRLHAVHMD